MIKTNLTLLPVFLLTLVLAGCGSESAFDDSDSGGGSGSSGSGTDGSSGSGTDGSSGSGTDGSSGSGTDGSSGSGTDGSSGSGSGGSTSDDVVGGCTLTNRQRALLDAHNEARATARSCGSRGNKPAVPPLKWHCTLEQAAFDHSKDMGDVGFFDHTGSDGLSPSQRMTNAGYAWRAAGENIAAGYNSVEAVMNGWLKSDGHCANIMGSAYTQMGGGIYEPSPVIQYSIYWTVNFGTPR